MKTITAKYAEYAKSLIKENEVHEAVSFTLR